MKKYTKPMVMASDELSEGVYMNSGTCYSFQARICQTPALGHEVYTIQMDGQHAATDGHHSTSRNVVISFNLPVEYAGSNAASCSGSGTNTLILTFTDGVNGSYHNNGKDNIGLGQLLVKSDDGLAITGCYCNFCNEGNGCH